MGGLLVNYQKECTKAMQMLSHDSRVIFIGQTTCYPGSVVYATLKDIPEKQKIEMPVAEELQLGISIGLALQGFIPVSIFPRMDFMMRCMDQLVNHLDKIAKMSCGQYKPKVIVRTLVGSSKPMYPGLQHCQDHGDAMRLLLPSIDIYLLKDAKDIIAAYDCALNTPDRSCLIIEYADLYKE